MTMAHNNGGSSSGSSRSVLLSPRLPRPRGLPLIGSTLSVMLAGGYTRLHEYIDTRHRQLGPVFRDNFGPVDCVFVSDPDDMRLVFSHEGRYPLHVYPDAWQFYNRLKNVKRGIFFMDGEEWFKFRKIMNQVMLKEADYQWYYNPCEQVATDLVTKWQDLSEKKKEIGHLTDHLYRWSVDSVTAVLLGHKYNQESKKKTNAIITDLTKIMQDVFDASANLSLMPTKVAWRLKLPLWNRFENSVDMVLSRANTLAAMLLDLHQGGDGLLERLLSSGISKQDSIRIITDLILAAGDTSVHTMEWVLYLLGKNPHIQKRIYQQIANAELEKEIPPILKGAIRETLRLFPTATFLTRILPKDIYIKGYHIAAYSPLILSIYTSGRDEKYFADPLRFWPERWNRCNIEKSLNHSNFIAAVSHASLPFAMGARSCIGKKLAEAQLYITVGKILQNLTVDFLNPKDIEMRMLLVSVPSEPIRLSVASR